MSAIKASNLPLCTAVVALLKVGFMESLAGTIIGARVVIAGVVVR